MGSQREAQIAAGESLIIFTDGATEINDAGGTELGVDGLCGFIREQDFDEPDAALCKIEAELLK